MVIHKWFVNLIIVITFVLELLIFYLLMTGSYTSPLCL